MQLTGVVPLPTHRGRAFRVRPPPGGLQGTGARRQGRRRDLLRRGRGNLTHGAIAPPPRPRPRPRPRPHPDPPLRQPG
jgi:hypothetical protein